MEESSTITGKARFHRKVFYILVLLVAFFLPIFGRIVPPLIALMTLNWVMEWDFPSKLRRIRKSRANQGLLAFGILYVLYLVGMIYSHDTEYGWFDMEIKFTMLLFPVIFSTTHEEFWEPARMARILRAFIAGCFVSTLLLLGHSAYISVWEHSQNAFAYENLSWFQHPSYVAMYMVLAIATLVWFLLPEDTAARKHRIDIIFLILWFFEFIIMLSSKAGILGLVMIVLLGLIMLAVRTKSVKTVAIWFVIAILAFFIALRFTSVATMRLTSTRDTMMQQGEPAHPNSTTERLDIWKAGLQILRHDWLFGVGTGDVKDVLMETYKVRHLDLAYSQHLNAHNQYLQTFLALGIPGILALLGVLLIPLIPAYRKRNHLYMAFLLLFALNIAVESMLEIQAGVVFYAFFNAVLFRSCQASISTFSRT